MRKNNNNSTYPLYMSSPFNLAWNLLKGFDSRYPPAIEAYRERSDDERYYPPVTMAHDAHDHLDDESHDSGTDGVDKQGWLNHDNEEMDMMADFYANNPDLKDKVMQSAPNLEDIDSAGMNKFELEDRIMNRMNEIIAHMMENYRYLNDPPDPAKNIEDWYN